MKYKRLTATITLATSFAIGAGAGRLAVTTIGADAPDPSAPATGSGVASVSVENPARRANDIYGSVQAVRGIEGIDTVMLQNLETVLRMQDRPREEQGKGGASTAAGLMALEAPEQLEETPDAREEHMEFELEGS